MKTLKNSVTLTGHLGRNPEIIEIGSGKKLARLSLAVQSSSRKDEDSKPAWFNLVAFDQTAGYAEKYLSKGEKVMITGRLSARSWTDKEGNTRQSTEVVVGEFVKFNPATRTEA
jgi:single-strand DNA-binding protein